MDQNAEGLLDYLPGERIKYINVTIIDNSVPELDKVFRVELYNPQGGGKRPHSLSFHYRIDENSWKSPVVINRLSIHSSALKNIMIRNVSCAVLAIFHEL